MTTKEYAQWLYRGYADNQERTPGKRAPKGPKVRQFFNDAQKAYWDGFYSGAMNAMAAAQRNSRERAN